MFDADGKKVGSRNSAGFYPDDLAVSPDGRFLFVLSSGRAGRRRKKPLPALDVVAIDRRRRLVASRRPAHFDPADDPERLTLSASGRFAAVFLAKSKQTAAVDLTSARGASTDRSDADGDDQRALCLASPDADWIMMPGPAEGDTIAIEWPGASPSSRRDGNAPPPSRRLPDLHAAERIGPGDLPDVATAHPGPLSLCSGRSIWDGHGPRGWPIRQSGA